MKRISIGILAHVDAGKTTLTESILYRSGAIKAPGRVDNGDAFLDTEALEKKRGVTIYSKQAVIDLNAAHHLNGSGDDLKITIIDTPGHTDFVGETGRALSVMDLAVLIVSATDGVTDTTVKLRSMLEEYKVPFFLFVNKMDMSGRSTDELEESLRKEFGSGAISVLNHENGLDRDREKTAFEEYYPDRNIIFGDRIEDIASLREDTIEKYLEKESLSSEDITDLIYSGVFHPVIFGSAIRHEGTDELIRLICGFLPKDTYRDSLSARVFKIIYEEGHKLAFLKITGGRISVRDTLPDDRLDGAKITQIRRYSGGKYDTLNSAEAGDVVTVLGLENAFSGMGIGEESDDEHIIATPVLRYRMILPDDVPVRTFIPKIRELASEDPLLNADTDSPDGSISISVMGAFQLEILTSVIGDRFGVKVKFDNGSVIYKETIASPVMGFGHFEPLKHYAEVQLLMEPLPEGSGIEVASAVSVDDLAVNWQRSVFHTILNDTPKGVLTGSAITDMRITIADGRSHVKHTEGGDFREATRRAIRHGLMKAENMLLEPWYEYRMTIPADLMGRAMNDMNMKGGTCSIEEQTETACILSGEAPARELVNYQSVLITYTSGRGSIQTGYAGYRPCPEEYAEETIRSVGYDPDADLSDPTGSVFCSHGAGVYVPWYECEERMHTQNRAEELIFGTAVSGEDRLEFEAQLAKRAVESKEKTPGHDLYKKLDAIGTDEIDDILYRSSHANAVSRKHATKRVYHQKRVISAASPSSGKSAAKAVKKPKYLLVDGYNIIHAWDELKSLLSDDPYSLDGAKYRLLDMLSEYRVVRDTEVIAVFDAYKVKGHVTEKMDYMGVHVVYTKTAETADQYIARFTVENSKNLDITVATSDGLVQLIIRGENCRAYSAADLLDDVKRAHAGQ